MDTRCRVVRLLATPTKVGSTEDKGHNYTLLVRRGNVEPLSCWSTGAWMRLRLGLQ